MSSPKQERSNLVQSVDRALAIMEFLAAQGDASVTDIAKALGIHKSTAFRLLATLEQRGFVEQERNRGNYRLGLSLVHLAGTVTSNLELVRLGRPICERLSQETQETVNLALLERDTVLNIDQVIGDSAVVSMNWVGHRSPLSCTSTGKAILAFLPELEQLHFISKPLERCTEHSIQKFEILENQLKDARTQGYAFTIEELELGMNAVAAPIFSFEGRAIAAICVSGPSYRLIDSEIPRLGELTKNAAREISSLLGWKNL